MKINGVSRFNNSQLLLYTYNYLPRMKIKLISKITGCNVLCELLYIDHEHQSLVIIMANIQATGYVPYINSNGINTSMYIISSLK